MKQLAWSVVLSLSVIGFGSACSSTPSGSSSGDPSTGASSGAPGARRGDVIPMLPPGHAPTGQAAGDLPPGHMPVGMGAANLPPGHTPVNDPSAALPPGHGAVEPPSGAADPAGGGSPLVTGTVAETMDAASYTYMRLTTANGDVWVAAMQMPVAVGNQVEASGSMMPGFHSNTLNRTFDQIVFASSARVVGAGSPAPAH